MLTATTRRTLDRHIELALRHRFGADVNLRKVVHQVVLEMATLGAPDEAIRDLLTRSVDEHPQRPRWDRVSIVTGLAVSAVLTRRMLHWAERTVSPRGAATAGASAGLGPHGRRKVTA